MQTIIIDEKEYKVVDAVAEEINWLNSRLKTAKRIIESLEDLDDEFDTQRIKYLEDRYKLLNEIKEL
jgi:hypothetical protein